MPVQAVITDFDGTLYGPGRQIPQSAWDTIAWLKEQGIPFHIATGRPYASFLRCIDSQELAEAPGVFSDGSIVRDEHGRPHVLDCFEPELVMKIWDLLTQYQQEARENEVFHFSVQAVHWVYTRDAEMDRGRAETLEEFRTEGKPLIRVVAHISDAWEVYSDSPMAVVITGDDDGVVRRVAERLSKAVDLPPLIGGNECALVVSNGCNKVEGVKHLCKLFGYEDVLVLGDADNDEQMLATYPLSVAMGGATVKAAITTDTAERDGWAKAVLSVLTVANDITIPRHLKHLLDPSIIDQTEAITGCQTPSTTI